MSTDRDDIEMAFIRILSTQGLILSGIPVEDRRERIRVTIMQRGLKDKLFDEDQTYGQAFERCYRRAPELRRLQRDEHSRPQVHTRAGPGDDEGDEEDEGLKAVEHRGVVRHAVAVPAVIPGPAGELVPT